VHVCRIAPSVASVPIGPDPSVITLGYERFHVEFVGSLLRASWD
jgi:hypothetical protein